MEKERVLINSGWRFCLTGDASCVEKDFDDADWRRVELPHDWQIEGTRAETAPKEQGLCPRAGVGVYRYHFTAPVRG